MLKLVQRDIEDAKVKGISSDRKFATAYNAALQLASILLYAEGYKPKGLGHHFIVFEAMKEILSGNYVSLADYFDACRAKRNITDYSYAGEISDAEAKELIREAEAFLKVIVTWLRSHHADLI